MSHSNVAPAPATPRGVDAAPATVLTEFALRLAPVACEEVPLERAGGRVLAGPLLADRDSPATDVGAMDGYAICCDDCAGSGGWTLPVDATARIGALPPPLRRGTAVRIVTGAPVPVGADAVVPREDVAESAASITIPAGYAFRRGRHIRRTGENIRAAEVVVPPGGEVTPSVAAALAAFGVETPRVHRRVRVGIVVTGDELLAAAGAGRSPAPWQLRDTNGPGLRAMCGAAPWVELVELVHARDELAAIERAVARQLERCDALFVTGGVSMGERDFVPAAVQRSGAELVFHRLPIRPGKPLLGAVGPRGQAVFGLPGNPVSVLVTARRFGAIALRRRAGYATLDPRVSAVTVPEGAGGDPHRPPTGFWWYRSVRLTGAGMAALVPTRGSGDSVSAARGDGFIEVPPGGTGPGPWPLYGWTL